tara:strand:+ start:217 stop:837 length:621 start_codon:yes stop_codon:yes gene_type:complete
MSQYKFIGGDGETYGPYSREEMQQFMAENRVNSQTRVSADDGAWQTAGQLPELASGDAPPVPAILGMPAAPSAPAAYGMTQPTVKPGKLQAMAIMTLVGGIIATISSIIWGIYAAITAIFTLGIGCICLIGPIYQMVAGILCIIQGSKLLGKNPDPCYAKTKKTAIMQIICIICFDVLNLTLGIISLVFLNDEEVKAYIRSRGGQI